MWRVAFWRDDRSFHISNHAEQMKEIEIEKRFFTSQIWQRSSHWSVLFATTESGRVLPNGPSESVLRRVNGWCYGRPPLIQRSFYSYTSAHLVLGYAGFVSGHQTRLAWLCCYICVSHRNIQNQSRTVIASVRMHSLRERVEKASAFSVRRIGRRMGHFFADFVGHWLDIRRRRRTPPANNESKIRGRSCETQLVNQTSFPTKRLGGGDVGT